MDCQGETERNPQWSMTSAFHTAIAQSPLGPFPERRLPPGTEAAAVGLEASGSPWQCPKTTASFPSLTADSCHVAGAAVSDTLFCTHDLGVPTWARGSMKDWARPRPIPPRDAQHRTWPLLQREGNTKMASLQTASLNVKSQAQRGAEQRPWGRGRVEF